MTDEVKGQIRGTKRVKPDMPNVADILKSKVEEVDDCSLESQKWIQDVFLVLVMFTRVGV